MKRKRYKEEQIVRIVGEVLGGKSIAQASREYAVSENTIRRWRDKYGDMEVNEVKRLKQLETENRRLKEIVAQQALDNAALKDLLSRKW
ncbi:MAG: transposase [Bacteroidales bacterium]|nr:transposase [Candidatus Latescibacterota bacterium]